MFSLQESISDLFQTKHQQPCCVRLLNTILLKADADEASSTAMSADNSCACTAHVSFGILHIRCIYWNGTVWTAAKAENRLPWCSLGAWDCRHIPLLRKPTSSLTSSISGVLLDSEERILFFSNSYGSPAILKLLVNLLFSIGFYLCGLNFISILFIEYYMYLHNE